MTDGAARSGSGNLDRLDAAAVCALIALPLALYAKAAAQFWSGDDTQILKHALSHSLAGIFTVPAEWRQLSWLYFTPLVDLSARVDLALFGLEPHGWYLRHLLFIGVAASLLYVLLRGWVGRVAAASAAMFLLAGPPVAEVARQLWARHYVEGLAFALAALLLFRRAVVRASWTEALAAGASGLAAMLGKEVYAAVPLVALALPCGTLRRRLRAALPLLAALAVYLPWRQAMVGYWGGIGRGESLLEPARRTFGVLGRLPAVLAGLPAAAGLVLLVLALVLLRPSRVQGAAIVFVAALVLAPLALLRDAPAARYAIVPLTAAAVLAAAAADAGLSPGGIRRALGVLLLTGILVPAAMKGRATFAAATPVAARSRAEALFFERQSARGDVLYRPVESAWFFEGLGWLRASSHGGEAGSVVYDAIVLCDASGPGRIFAYDAAVGDVVRDSHGPAAEIASVCSRLDRTMPLSADLTYRDSTLAWRLGPEQDGTWAFLSGETAAPYSVAREGSLFIRFTGDVNLRVRHEAPDGRIGLSPLLTLHVKDGTASASLEARKTPER